MFASRKSPLMNGVSWHMQEFDHVMSAMSCWNISSNAADHWQQFLHQQHFSVIGLYFLFILAPGLIK